MKKTFFIYTLPRSGSAWLSQFLCWGGAFCYHEPLVDGGPAAMRLRWEDRPEEIVGAIDTSAYRLTKSIEAEKKFVLIRDSSDILKSARKLGLMEKDVDEERRHMLATAGHAEAIYYSKLHNIMYLETLWARIVGTPFDYERATYFVEMNVQRDLGSIKDRMRR